MKQEIPVIECKKELLYSIVSLYFPGGSSLEDEETLGFAHFCEHLAFKLRADGAGIAEFAENIGGYSNAFTSNDAIVFEIVVQNKFVSQTLAFLEKIFSQNFETISNVDFEEEKRVILEEIAIYEDEPCENLFSTLISNIFPSHIYGKKILGEKSTILSASKEKMAAFWQERLLCEPFLVISGGYEGKPSMKLECYPKKQTTFLNSWEGKKIFELSHKEQKCYFAAGWKLPPQSGRLDAILKMIYTITIGMDGAKLYNRLVYEKSVFDSLLDLSSSNVLASTFVQMGIMPSDKIKQRLEKWISAWNECEFTQNETAKAREVILSDRYFDMEGVGKRAESAGRSYLLFKEKEKLDKDFFYEFMHLTADDLNKFKNDYLNFDKMVFGFLKSPNCKFKIDSLSFPKSSQNREKRTSCAFKKEGVRGFIKPIRESSFLTGYILKKNSPHTILKNRAGSFNLFLNSLFASAQGMTRKETRACLDRFGITLSPVCSANVGGATFKVRDVFVKEAFDIIKKFFDNEIKEEDFIREKARMLSDISVDEENPGYRVKQAICRELFKGTPYAELISGSKEGIEKTAFKDLLKIKNSFFKYNDFSIALSGAVDMEDLDNLAGRFVKKNVIKSDDYNFQRQPLGNKIVKIPLKGKNQVYVARVFRGPSVYDDDFETVNFLENYLGFGEKSPLFQELREKKGLVYALDVSGMSGLFGGYLLCSAITSLKNVGYVQEAIDKAIEGLKGGKILEDRLEENKRSAATFFAASLVSTKFHASNLAIENALGQPSGNYLKRLEIVNSITSKDLAASAKKWLDDGLWILAGGI